MTDFSASQAVTYTVNI